MKITQVRFIKSATSEKHFPSYSFPEFAFLGRSNVGKSSLINMITGKKGLVKVGAKPGVTRTLNFFLLNDRISLVDLPGYGYARVSKEIRKTFPPMIKNYLSRRESLKLLFLLIDIRRVPDESENDMISFAAIRDIPVAVIATKCDKLSRSAKLKAATVISCALGLDRDHVFFSSSKSKEGKKEILSLIRQFSD